MASNGLSELISVTNNVVKSLSGCTTAQEKSRNITRNAAMNMDPNYAGSPFESPRSHDSQSDSGMGKTKTPEPSFPRGVDSKIDKNWRRYGKDNNKVKTKKVGNFEDKPSGDMDNPKKTIEGQGKYIDVKGIDQNESGEELQIIDVQAKATEITLSSGMGQEALDESVESGEPMCQSGQFFPQKLYGKTSSSQYPSLKQGALSKGALDPTQQTVFDDVYISQFHSSERQKGIRETLAKRSEDSKPKKQHIQPQIIHSNSRSGDESDKDSAKHATGDRIGAISTHPEADPSVTAAVAASAAVAATQPFLKAQQDLESRMQQLLAQLAQKQKETTSQIEKDTVSGNLNSTALEKDEVHSKKRISELERQVAEMNERRLEHLESLQQQQIQMQAQLLMMSRSRSPKSHLVLPARQASPPRALQGSRIPQAVTKSNKNNSSHGRLQCHSRQPEPMAPQLQSSYFNPETLSKHHNYLSEVRELQGSLLDTPAPRKTVPEPTPYSLIEEPQTNLGFLQELLNQKETPMKDTTFSVKGNKSPGILSNRNDNAKGRRLDKSPVDQARRLVNSLSTLERETSESVWGSKEALNKDVELMPEGPAPLDFYLKYPKATEGSPYPNFGDNKQQLEKKQRRRSHSGNYLEAKQVLKELEMTKNTLERNLEQVVRSQRDVHVFNALLSQAYEGGTNDQTRIEKLVSKKIASLSEDIQTQVLRGLAEEEAKKVAMEMEQAQLKAAVKKNAGRLDYTKANTFKRMVEEAKFSQSKAGAPVTRFSTKAKENKILSKKQPAKPSVITDEKTMTRTYGKAEYQRGRTTIRDPYLHFQNTKKGRPIGPNDSIVSRDGRSRSPKNKKTMKSGYEPHIPRQYFFSPTRGYIPLESAASGPIEGQMIPMAIPLGAPRMEPGVRKTAAPVLSTSDPITSTPVPVTAMTHNAAVISFPVEDDRDKRKKDPELSKQVLPPIDIDSISPSSSRRSDIQIRSPQQAHPNVTFLCESYDSQEINMNMNKNFEDESDDDQTGEGIKLPGYEPKVPYYTGPSFPPQPSKAKPDWMAGGEQVHPPPLVSDVMAEDLRRRDVLENNAITWLEQELMARVLTEVMPLKMTQENVDVSTAQSVKSEESEREDSLLVADMIGHGGLQLFIDAGQPVDNALVNALVKEVIQERVNSMLSQRVNEDEKHRTLAKLNVRDEDEEALHEREKAKPPQVPTPEMTPKTSPVASPRRYKTQIQQPETPPLSPPPNANIFKPPKDLIEETGASEMVTQQPPPQPQPIPSVSQHVDIEKPQVPEVESESEVSVSVDISEELRRIGGKETEPSGYVNVCHDVATPPISPQPVLEEETAKPITAPIQATPPASPPPVTPLIMAEASVPPKHQPEIVKQQRMEEKVQEEEDKEEEEEEEEEEIIEQPRPIMMSIAVGDDRPMSGDREMPAKPRSPSPQRYRSQSPPSESQILSEESTLSDSVNENISEGQWLLSRSEGQIVGLPGKVLSRDLRKGYQQMVDLSTASTLRDTEDIDLDESHGPKSDGEILLSGLPAPEDDPMLELLVQMQKNPLLAIQKDLSKARVSQVLQQPDQRNVMGRSLGEMSVGQVAPSRLVQVKPRRVDERERQRRDKDRTSPSFSPTNSLERSVTEENYSFEEDKRMASREVNGRQQQRTTSPQGQRYAQQQQRRNRSPDLMPRPNNYGSKQSDFRNRTRGQMQYQPVLSDSAPSATKSRSPAKYNRQRESVESYRVSRSSEQVYRKSGSSNFRQNENSISDLYSNDQITRSADSLSYRRSGEGALTSSLKSKQSNVKKSVEFDLTGTFGHTKSSVSKSKDSNMSGSTRLSNAGGSLGLTYSFDDSAEEELKRIMNDNGTSYGPYRMSVTLPSTGHENESDASDFDFSQNE